MYVFGATRALGRTLNTVVIWYNEPKKSSQLVSWKSQCSREILSDFSAISGNLLEFAQLQMKKEKEEGFCKKRESSSKTLEHH